MEFLFNCEKALASNQEGLSVLDGRKPVMNSTAARFKYAASEDNIAQILDKMGESSAKAQKLPQVITTNNKFYTSDNKIYIKAEGNTCIGFIKVGKRNLFIRNEYGGIREISPLCVLDFYVHESCQRGGFGKNIFEFMLEQEGVLPEKLGYDRPSEKLLGFLAKYYGLKRFIPQNNNYVVYEQYWDSQTKLSSQQQSAQFQTTYGNMGGNPQNRRTQSTQNQPFIAQVPDSGSRFMKNKNQSTFSLGGNDDEIRPQQQYSQKQFVQQPQVAKPPSARQSRETGNLRDTGMAIFGNQRPPASAHERMPLRETQKQEYPKESVNSLISDLGSLNIGETKNANQKKYEQIGSRIQETEQQLAKVNQDIAQMKQSNGFGNYPPPKAKDQFAQPSRGSGYGTKDSMGGLLSQGQTDESNYPPPKNTTSKIVYESYYNKRNQAPIVNPDLMQKRLQDNADFVAMQKNMQRGSRVPFASHYGGW